MTYSTLPDDAIYEIISHLTNPFDIINCCYVNKQFNKVAMNQLLWKKICDDKISQDIMYWCYYGDYYYCYKMSYLMHDMIEIFGGLSVGDIIKETNIKWIGCDMTRLIGGLRYLSKLQTLDLSQNRIKLLPDFISNFTELKSFNISGNRLSKLPKNITYLENLERLNLDWNNFKEFPIELTMLTKLKELTIASNSIQFIPSEIKNMRSLRDLTIGGMNIVDLPDEMCELTCLRTLDISYNKFFKIPNCVYKLDKLIMLNASHNQINELSPEIANMTNLLGLYLNNNKIKNVPDEFEQLKNLQVASFSYNDLNKKINTKNMPKLVKCYTNTYSAVTENKSGVYNSLMHL